jgi:hypothetical protein
MWRSRGARELRIIVLGRKIQCVESFYLRQLDQGWIETSRPAMIVPEFDGDHRRAGQAEQTVA